MDLSLNYNNAMSVQFRTQLIIVMMCALSACAEATPSTVSAATLVAITPVVTDTVSARTVVPAPTDTPSPTRFFPPTPTLSPALLEALFFGGKSEDCQLPCWEGLSIGESTPEDVQSVFDRIFGVNGYLYDTSDWANNLPEYTEMAEFWRFEPEDTSSSYVGKFYVLAWVDSESQLLEGLQFNFSVIFTPGSEEPQPDANFQRILRELKTPSTWLVELRPGGQGEGFHIQFYSYIKYASGINFYHFGELPATVSSTADGIEQYTAELCLSDHFARSINISRPITESGANPTPLQEFLNQPVDMEVIPIEDALGINLKAIYQRATEEDNPCFVVVVDH
jgi:hypothetical protein